MSLYLTINIIKNNIAKTLTTALIIKLTDVMVVFIVVFIFVFLWLNICFLFYVIDVGIYLT